MRLALILAALLLAGCEEARYTVSQQAEDYQVCKAAGMDAYLNGYGEVKCAPPTTTGEGGE